MARRPREIGPFDVEWSETDPLDREVTMLKSIVDMRERMGKHPDPPSGITVMYAADGSAIGAEVSDFSERYSLPATIHVDARTPFDITVKETDGMSVA